MTTPQSMEERFDEQILNRRFKSEAELFLVPKMDNSCKIWAVERRTPEVLDFIRAEKELSKQEGAKITSQDVGMLRQWLNEDRITDTEKMVKNEDIIYWIEAACNPQHHA